MQIRYFLPCLLFVLSGCDQVNQALGVEDPAKKEARQEAEGRAVGGACRHSGRAIEDCYAIYSWLPKAAVFGGWRDMDTYMRENKIDTVAPQLPPPEPPGKKRKKAADADADEPAKKAESGKDEKAPEKGEKTEKSDKPEVPEKAPEKADKASEKPAARPAAKH